MSTYSRGKQSTLVLSVPPSSIIVVSYKIPLVTPSISRLSAHQTQHKHSTELALLTVISFISLYVTLWTIPALMIPTLEVLLYAKKPPITRNIAVVAQARRR